MCIVGWYGMAEETISHETITPEATLITPLPAGYHEPLWPMETPFQGNLYTRAHEGILPIPTKHHLPARVPAVTNGREDPTQAILIHTTASEDPGQLTVVQTIILTITSIVTDTQLKTVTTTVFVSTCITCAAKPTTVANTDATSEMTPTTTTTTEDVMTGLMYCSFTGRRNIYTLCPRVHTSAPGMLASAPAVVSSATARAKNPLTALRLAFASLWGSIPSFARVVPEEDQGGCECECAAVRNKLDAAVDLVRVQQQLLDSQRAVIGAQRKGLLLALDMLANMTAARGAADAARGRAMDLKI
ncbi:hypothetical protein F4825DRAFT_433424 [Nemania diffusa]|nr:hypothetical protein F4825DRAFT_433424 [Nemania diffusa]